MLYIVIYCYICRIFINKTKRAFHESFFHTQKNHRGQKLTKMTACQMSTCKSEKSQLNIFHRHYRLVTTWITAQVAGLLVKVSPRRFYDETLAILKLSMLHTQSKQARGRTPPT